MKKKFVVVLIAAIIICTLFTFFKSTNESPDKQLIKRVLEIAVVSGEIPDYNLLKDKKNIIISTENINPSLLPEFPSVKLIALSSSEIKEKANREGDFLYLRFKSIYFTSTRAIISLDNIWAVADNSKKGYLSGGGMAITFHRFFGRWIEDKSRMNWIS